LNLPTFYPDRVDRLNLALGALAVALTAAILAVLLIGGGEGSAMPGGTTPTVPQPATSIVTSTPPTTEGSGTEYQMPERLEGTWLSTDGTTIVRFSEDTIESFQSMIDLERGSVALVTSEPARLGATPTTRRTVQAVVFVTAEEETRRTGPDPILIEFVASPNGLTMSFEIAGSEHKVTLLPS
jgi:hypothetical protein